MYTFRFFFADHPHVEITGVVSVKSSEIKDRIITGNEILETIFPLCGTYFLSGNGTSDIVGCSNLYHIEVTKEE